MSDVESTSSALIALSLGLPAFIMIKILVIPFFVMEDTNCYPMVAPGKSNSQMMGIFNKKNLNKSQSLIKQKKKR